MYHIKSDRRSQASAAEIVRGMQECLNTMPLRSITVSDLHRATGISRATFYRLFDTPEDVLDYQFDQMARAHLTIDQQTRGQSASLRLEKTVEMGMKYHDFIRALVENRRFDLLYEYTEKSFRQMDSQMALFPGTMGPIEKDYVISHLSMTMVASLITWAKNGRRESAAEVVEYLRRYIRIVSELVGDV